MEGEFSPERMQQAQFEERVSEYRERGLTDADAARLAYLTELQHQTPLSENEQKQRQSLMEKIRDIKGAKKEGKE